MNYIFMLQWTRYRPARLFELKLNKRYNLVNSVIWCQFDAKRIQWRKGKERKQNLKNLCNFVLNLNAFVILWHWVQLCGGLLNGHSLTKLLKIQITKAFKLLFSIRLTQQNFGLMVKSFQWTWQQFHIMLRQRF